MSVNTAAIQQLYVAYFNRPADFSGLGYWEGVVANAKGSTAAVSAAFAASAEYKATYAGMDEGHIVAQIYQNLFNRGPDLGGLNFWTQALLNKAVTIDNVVATIAGAAANEDKVTINNKVAAAIAFSAALDTPAEALGYAGDKANGIAKQWLSNVGSDASLAVAIDKTALDAVVQNVVDNGPQPVGVTYSLGLGQDIINGTTGNDVINAYSFNAVTGEAGVTTLSTFDTIDGGAGKDTLNLMVTGTANATTDAVTGVVTINAGTKNVEIINIDESGAAAGVAVDASMFAGATLINQMGKAGNVTNLAAGSTAGFQGSTIAGALSVAAAGASAGVSFNGVSDAATLAVSGATLNSVTVSGARVHVGGGTVAGLTMGVTAGKDVTSLAVNTNQKTTLTVAETGTSTKHIATLDASASTGAVTFNESLAANVKVANVMTGAGADTVTIAAATSAATSSAAAVNASVATGAGNDTIVVSTTGTGLTSVDGGAGDDKITVNKITGAGVSVQGGDGNDTVTIVGNIETSDIVNGGAGSNTVAVAGAATRTADDFIVFNKLLTNFQTIQFTSAEGALDASQLGTNYATIDLFAGSTVTNVGTQALVAHGALNATADGYAVDANGITYAGSLNITEKATGNVTANADVVSLTVKATTDTAATATAPAVSGNVDAFLFGEAKTVNVTLTNSVNATSNATADTIATVIFDNGAQGDAGATSVTLKGNGTAFVTNADGTALTTVDASALGGTFTLGANAGNAIDGLVYETSNTKAETIKLGAGIDFITIDAGASTYNKGTAILADSISGLHLVANSAGTALTAASDHLTVAGVSGQVGGVAKFTTTQTDLDLALKEAAVSAKGDNLVFNLGGNTYVYHDGGTTGVVDATDVLVKIVGGVDLDALVIALG